MYCSNCGTFMNDTDQFCPNCGAGVNGQSPAPVQDEQIPVRAPRKKLSRGALIGILAGAAAVVIAVVLILVFTLSGGSNSPEGVIRKFVNALYTYDLQGMIDTSIPDEVLNYVLQDEGMSRSEFQRQLNNAQKQINEYQSEIGSGGRASFEITILRSQPLGRNDLEDLNDYYSKRFRTGKYYISEAQMLTIAAASPNYGSTTEDVVVFKVNGKWYVSLDDVPNALNYIF